MLIEKSKFNELTNYEKLIATANTFRHSQGFYGRLFQQLMEMSEEEIEQLNTDTYFSDCNEILDVVLKLEQ